jgi:hypothetical protein
MTPKEVFLRDMKWIEQCDIFIADVSGSSFGLGFDLLIVEVSPRTQTAHSKP